jgi:aminomethyltransferase
MKRTPIYDEHIKLNAKMIDFSGWDMPLEYTKILDEHMAVRENVGIFDVSHMGDVIIEGPDSNEFVDYLFPTKASDLKEGQCVYTAFLDDDGNIIDDTIVYRMGNHKFFFVPNAGTTDLIVDWVNKHKGNYNVNINNVSSKIASIALQGPKAENVLNEMNIDMPEPFTFAYVDNEYRNELTETDNIIISGTGYTGENGIEFILPAEYAGKLWTRLVELITKYNGLPCGLGARDTLRMEKGMLLSGHDFNRDRNPYECSVSFIVNLDHEFIGKENLEKKKETSNMRFRGFILEGRGIPRQGYPVFSGETKIGEITSGTSSPVLGKGIGLGYIDKKYMKAGNNVEIDIRGRKVTATVSRPKIVP